MKATKAMMKSEAINRMKALKLMKPVIEEFRSGDVINMSEPLYGFLYWLDDEAKQMVKEIEEKYGGMVYHCIVNNTEFGQLLTMLYVTSESDEWNIDLEDIKNNVVFAYVKNITAPECSEFGRVIVKPCNGGLLRIG